MASIQREIYGDFDFLLHDIHDAGELAFLDKMRAFCESRQQKIKE